MIFQSSTSRFREAGRTYRMYSSFNILTNVVMGNGHLLFLILQYMIINYISGKLIFYTHALLKFYIKGASLQKFEKN